MSILELSKLERISGPRAVAFSKPSSRWWTVVPLERIPENGLPLGLQVLLAKPDRERHSDPATTAKSVWWRVAWTPAALSNNFVLYASISAIVLMGFAGPFFLLPNQALPLPLLNHIDLWLSGTVTLLTWLGLYAATTALLCREIRGNVGYWGLGPWPRMERVIWQLGISRRTALAILLLALSLATFSIMIYRWLPTTSVGVLTGTTIFLITESYPLLPGPGACLLGSWLRLYDLPRQLNWAIVSRMLMIRLARPSRAAIKLGIAALYLLAWLIVAGFGWAFMINHSMFQATTAGRLWSQINAGAALVYLLWLCWEVARLIWRGQLTRDTPHFQIIDPPASAVERWQTQSALLRHIPTLRDAPWHWASVNAGAFLIRSGSRERRFFWLASGRANVIVQDKNGAPVLAATLGAGSGVGEIGLLDDRPRTADVVIEETAIVAYLEHAEFERHCNAALKKRFREVVLAAQSLARTAVFWGMPDYERERWLAYGLPRHYDPGDALIKEGDNDVWIGLLVEGQIAVERGEATVAEIGPDSVFGEIAYLIGGVRTATLRALTPTLVWRWDADWLDAELGRAGIHQALQKLAEQRSEQAKHSATLEASLT